MRDLKLSYRQTYWQLRKALKDAEKLRIDEAGNLTRHPDIDTIKGAMSDVAFSIAYMHTGRIPGNKRGIERRAAYQREKLVDPMRMQAYVANSTAGSPSNVTEWQRYQIEDALSRLSPQERECYTLAHGQGFSFSYIGGLMGLSKGAVESYVTRAQKKVSQDLNSSLFLWDGE
jgi:RNA polymerase sigma-70 factor (ECF subfamily)